jgi:nicotinate phosphoribosyltransferase
MLDDIRITPDSALLLIDIQNDFLPDGALAVRDSEKILGGVFSLIEEFRDRRLPVLATRDWHPAEHASFLSQGGIWPAHCIQNSKGAGFPPSMPNLDAEKVFSKGREREFDQYSGFDGQNEPGVSLETYLRSHRLKRLFVAGLALDVCVRHTVLDARKKGFEVVLLNDLSKGINERETRRALDEMKISGAATADSREIRRIAREIPWRFPALALDLYELTMAMTYVETEMIETAAFELFSRGPLKSRNFLIAAGIETLLDFLESFCFTEEHIDLLCRTCQPGFETDRLNSLRGLRFMGDVLAVPEGTILFADEPILRIEAPIAQAQLIETAVVNIIHLQTMIASKAARCVLAASGRRLIEFGLRRAHGAEAGLFAARASYLAGFDASSNVLAGIYFGVPLSGTMAHSFIQAHENETDAFFSFAVQNPDDLTLLIDTYDTLGGAGRACEIARVLAEKGIYVKGLRLDSGDLLSLSKEVRKTLDMKQDKFIQAIQIVASGNLDEYEIKRLIDEGAPIDAFGVGTRLDVSSDRPHLDCAYKLVEYAGVPRLKLSAGKRLLPGRKQIFRRTTSDGRMLSDVIGLADESIDGEPLLKPMMKHGRRLNPPRSLHHARQDVLRSLEALPDEIKSLAQRAPFDVTISDELNELARRIERSPM